MGYIKHINPNTKDSHQMSPAYVLTFLRWTNKDTLNYTGEGLGPNGATAGPLDVRQPLVVYNDALQVSISNSKKSPNPSVTIQLKGGDINYSTALSPGDFCLVNFLTWETDAVRVRNKAINLQPINEINDEINDGFKGVFKIQSVVKDEAVDEDTGLKYLSYIVTAAGFTEFNNIIYYNPAIVNAFAQAGTLLWQSDISAEYVKLLKVKNDIDSIIKTLFKILIGQPIKSDVRTEINQFGSKQFRVPSTLGNLLGKKSVKYAADIFEYVVGIWGDSANSDSIKDGFNPSFTRDGADNYWSTGSPIQGNKQVELQNFNGNTAWSLINGFLNDTINEIYTTYRVNPLGYVQPTVVVRQKPFTTPHFVPPPNTPVTRYMELPRWKVNFDLNTKLQTSKNDSFRFNFVQVYTRSIPDPMVQVMDMARQIAERNFVSDDGDIERNGLRPYVKTANFDFPGTDNSQDRIRARPWALLVSDWVISGHLKQSGTASFAGIQDPISVGDNIEIDGTIYHIETITDIMTVNNNGIKKWRTNISVSYGMDMRSSKNGPVYAEMEHTDAHTNNVEDWNNERYKVGISDTQDIIGRVKGEEIDETDQKSFTPPNLRKPRKKQ